RKASQLERALINEHEGCSRTLLFDMVEPSGSPWPCGRCSICVTVGEHANKRPDKHKFNVAWPDQAWAGRCALGGGAWVVNPDEPTLIPHLDRLVRRLGSIGIEQFVATGDVMEALERSICKTNLNLGFVLLLGGDVPLERVPTAALIDRGA